MKGFGSKVSGVRKQTPRKPVRTGNIVSSAGLTAPIKGGFKVRGK